MTAIINHMTEEKTFKLTRGHLRNKLYPLWQRVEVSSDVLLLFSVFFRVPPVSAALPDQWELREPLASLEAPVLLALLDPRWVLGQLLARTTENL